MIESPPPTTTPADASSDTEEVRNLISSINSRYLYWSEVKYRIPSGMTGIELWSKVKSIRDLTNVRIWDQERNHNT